MAIKVLDCTLRDGGYYGDWDFSEEIVRKYLAAIATSKVDVVEIGFRSLPQDRYLGAFAFSTDDFLKTLPLPAKTDIAVMVNAKEIVNHAAGIEDAISRLFVEKQDSPVDIVRIATHHSDVASCEPVVRALHSKGYRVFLNIMQVDGLKADEVTGIARLITKWDSVETLYFADSFGNMDQFSVAEIIRALREGWGGKIGIHAHDNKGLALVNSIAALDQGIDYIDATLLGMGRGAGNAKMENLLVEITQRGYGAYFPDALFPLALKEFKELQKQYEWGPNIYYFLSAIYGIHPSYIQVMLGGELYDTEEILSAISFLKSTRAPFYSFENMLRALSGVPGNEHGEWSATDWVKGRDVLIISSGPSTKRHISAIQQYVDKRDPIVLCLNVNRCVPEEIITAYVACHETRILIESDHYRELDKPLILPLSRVPESIKETLGGVEVLDYGMRIDDVGMQIISNGCVLNNSLSLFYAIAVATAGGADRILLSGVDGYDASDPRYQEMVTLLEQYQQLETKLPIYSITPTTYPIQQRSVYDPDL